MTHFKKYTEEQFKAAISESVSKRQALIRLGIASQGGNYKVIDKAINELKLDISHFKGQGWNRGNIFGPKRPLEDYLSNKHSIGSHKLKIRLLKENVLPHICSKCQSTHWLDKPIPLELEHIDGNHDNNNIMNLCLLCPNCHAFTSTYRGKNKKKS